MKKVRAILLGAILAMGLWGCSGLPDGSVDYEDESCIVKDVVLDREGLVGPEITATFVNKTDQSSHFVGWVTLFDGADNEVGSASLFTEEIAPGESGSTFMGPITAAGEEDFVDGDDPMLDSIARMEVTLAGSMLELYGSDSVESAGDSILSNSNSIVGRWQCVMTDLGGERNDTEWNQTIYAEFNAGGSWEFVVGSDRYSGTWTETGDEDGVPYYFTFLDAKWGGKTYEDGGETYLLMLHIEDTDNEILLKR